MGITDMRRVEYLAHMVELLAYEVGDEPKREEVHALRALVEAQLFALERIERAIQE